MQKKWSSLRQSPGLLNGLERMGRGWGKNNHQLPTAHSIQSAGDCWVGKKSQKEKEFLSVTMILGVVNHTGFHWCLFSSVLGGTLEAERQEGVAGVSCHATWLFTCQLSRSWNHRNGKITKEIKSVCAVLSPHWSLLSPFFSKFLFLSAFYPKKSFGQ